MGRRVGAWLLALVVVGGLGVGGVLVARSSGSGQPPVLELAAEGGAQSDAAATAQARDIAPARPAAAGYAWPRVRYELPKDLPDLPDEARAWRLAPEVTAGRVAELARALGFSTPPTATQSGWRVFERGQLLQVSREFGAPWTYVANLRVNCVGARWGAGGPDGAVSSDVVDCPTPAPVAPGVPVPVRPCPPRTVCAQPRVGVGQQPDSAGSARSAPGSTTGSAGGAAAGSAAGAAAATDPSGAGSAGTGKPVPPTAAGQPVDDLCRISPHALGCPSPPPQPRDLPSRAQAERIARDWLAKAGVRLDGRTVRVAEQWSRWVVTASPEVEGRPTIGFADEVWVGVKGQVVHARSWLSRPEAGATYPLISVEEAVDRLQNRRVLLARSLTPDIAERYDPRCANPNSGRCPPRDVVKRITDIRLGLQHTAVLGAGDRAGRDAWLVPAYFFEINGNPDQVESVIALPDRFMRLPQPRPVPVPARPVPSVPQPATPEPGGQPSGGGGSGGTPGGG
jgi:hypothetical protein